jgi:hypothetical protein
MAETNPRFTHPGAEEIYTVDKDKMDAYADGWGRLADRVWEEEYAKRGSEVKGEMVSYNRDTPAVSELSN